MVLTYKDTIVKKRTWVLLDKYCCLILAIIFILGPTPQGFSQENTLAPHSPEPYSSDISIYILEDAHTSLAAQEQLSQQIVNLVSEENILLVGMEGASGLIDGETYKQLSSEKNLMTAINSFVKEGTLGAAEHAYFQSPLPFTLYGIEDKKIYSQNLSQYQQLLQNKYDAIRKLNQLESLLAEPFKSNNHKTMKTVLNNYQKLIEGKITLLHWYEKTDPLIRWKRIYIKAENSYFQLRQIMASFQEMNIPVMNQELKQLKIKLSPLLTPLEKKYLRQETETDPIVLWHELAMKHKVDISSYPQIKIKKEITDMLQTNVSSSLFSEIETLIWKLHLALAQNKEQKIYTYLKWQLHLTRKMCLGELTAQEKDLLHSLEQKHSLAKLISDLSLLPSKETQVLTLLNKLEPILINAHNFYSFAELRSFIMGQNLVSYMKENGLKKAILISGGFHTLHIKHFLNQYNISSSQWSPQWAHAHDHRVPLEDNVLKLHFKAPLENKSTIRFPSALKPIKSNPDSFRDSLLAELAKTDLTTTGSSMGEIAQTFKTPTPNIGLIVQKLIEGFSPKDSIGDTVLFENMGVGEEWPINSMYTEKSTEEVLRLLIPTSYFSTLVAAQYTNLVSQMNYNKSKNVIYSDVLLFVLYELLQELSQVDMDQFEEKREQLQSTFDSNHPPYVLVENSNIVLFGVKEQQGFHFSKFRAHWQGFWGKDQKIISNLFFESLLKKFPQIFEDETLTVELSYNAGDNVSEKIRQEIKKLEGKAIILFGYQPGRTSKAGGIDVLLQDQEDEIAKSPGNKVLTFSVTTPKEKPKTLRELDEILEEVKFALGAFIAFGNNLDPALKAYQQMSSSEDASLQMLRLTERGLITQTQSAMNQILRTVAEGKQDTLNQKAVNRLLLSPASRLFNEKPGNERSDWNEALVDFVNMLIRIQNKRLEEDQKLSLLPKEKVLENNELVSTLWELFHPSSPWNIQLNISPVENEAQKIIDFKFSDMQIRKSTNELDELKESFDYVIVGPFTFISIHPFLQLTNPTNNYAVYRIHKPSTGKEEALLIEDPLERTILSAALLSNRFMLGENYPSRLRLDSGYLEVDEVDPIQEIKSLHSQILDRANTTVIHEGAKSQVSKIRRMSEEDAELFKPIRARKTPTRNSDFRNKWERRKWENRVALSIVLQTPPSSFQESSAIKNSSTNLDFWARQAVRAQQNPNASFVHNKETNEISVTFASRSGIVLSESGVKFIIEGNLSQMSFYQSQVLGFKHQGLYLLASAFSFLESDSAPEQIKYSDIYLSWRPYLAASYKKAWNSSSKAKSLGVPILETKTIPTIQTSLYLDSFLSANRFQQNRNQVSSIVGQQEGPYELLVFWSALKKGILFSDLSLLLSSIEGLSITVVDDDLSREEIINELYQRDPEGLLQKHITQKQLIIPENPKLELQLKKSASKIKPIYHKYSPSFIGVVFNDQSATGNINVSEISSRAPKAMKFVAQGELDLGVISRSVFALIKGNVEGLFNQNYQGGLGIWVLSRPTEALLNQLMARFATQIALQTSA